MSSKTERRLVGPLTFWKVGILLLIAFLISGGIWLTMRLYQAQVETEYREMGALLIRQEATQADMERFEELWKQYEEIHSTAYHSFAWRQRRVGTTAAACGVGLFLWLLTLLQRGIIWLAKNST